MAGFWLMPRDAARTLGEVAEAGGAIRLTCAACRRMRQWWPHELSGLGRDTPMAAIARRAVCATCGARRGVLTIATNRRPRRRAYVTDRDLERIRALAEWRVYIERNQPA